ncbi:MAG TPA: endonuclease/exonuclease/phosphatase family protein [Luteibacter sp.]|jgi:endonuclease/exonuclease/phosphatase family metal-dependent hydrolase|nr:endonuclease/exonuclease/phosphatase family protein [Luteibacter sp.]
MPFFRRPLLLSLLAILTIVGLPAQAQNLNVMTFNVRLPVAADGPNRWEARRDLMASVIREAHPDVFGTQELFRLQGDDLVARLPEYTWFGRGRYGDDGDEHMGVFYRRDRLQVLESGNFWLSDTPDVAGSITWGHPLPRMVTWALFKRIADGKRFYYFNTHLPYRDEDEPARVKGGKEILARLKTLPKDVPVILTGDFNTGPESLVHQTLTSVLQDAWLTAPQKSGPEGTFHAFTGKPEKRIDWIMFRGVKANSVRVITTSKDGRYPSDHFPVDATLTL